MPSVMISTRTTPSPFAASIILNELATTKYRAPLMKTVLSVPLAYRLLGCAASRDKELRDDFRPSRLSLGSWDCPVADPPQSD
jgi:hypothetical protein